MQRRSRKLRSLLAVVLSAAMIFTAVPETTLVASAAEASQDAAIEAMLESLVAEPTEAVETVEEVVEEAAESTEATEATETVAESTEATEATETVAESTEATEATETAAESTEATETEAESTEATEATETVAESTEAIEATESSTEDVVVEEAAEIKDYQTSKLKITKKTTTMYSHQQNILVAEVAYAASTSGNGIGYTATVDAGRYSSAFYINDSDPYKVYVSIYGTIASGTYDLILTPVVPENVHAESVKVPIKVLPIYQDLDLEMQSSVYKPAGKSVSFQAKAKLLNSENKVVKAPITYSVAADYYKTPISGNQVTISKSGKVTISKDATLSSFYVFAEAEDAAKNYVSDYYNVSISKEKIVFGDLVTYNPYGSQKIYDYKNISPDNLNGLYLGVLSADETEVPQYATGKLINTIDFTYKSSNPKAISISPSGEIRVLNPTGKPVTLTVTAADGSKVSKSIQVTVSKKAVSANDIRLYGSIMMGGYFVISTDTAEDTETQKNVVYYENPTRDIFMLQISSSDGDYANASISKIKGAKNITSKTAALMKKVGTTSPMSSDMLYLVPTAQDVEITVKAGKETKTYILKDKKSQNAKKQVVAKGEPKITTSATVYKVAEEQKIKLYVGKAYAGKEIRMGFGDALMNGMDAYLTTDMLFLGIMGEPFGTVGDEVDEDGYLTVTFVNIDEFEAFITYFASTGGFKLKMANNIKFTYIVMEGGQALTTPTVVNIKFAKPTYKNDYKLQTNYTLQADFSTKKVYTLSSEGYSYLYSKLTYAGTKVPTDKVEFISLKGNLSETNPNTSSEFTDMVQLCTDGKDTYIGLSEYSTSYLAESGRAGETISGNLYLTYRLTSATGIISTKTDVIKVTFVVPKVD